LIHIFDFNPGLLEFGLKRMEEKEKDDFILVGYRRRKVKINSSG